jgi:type VI secretion system protein ImpM
VTGLIVGFYGKLPARGDFVRAGLPRDFTDPWDDWLQSVMAGSRAQMGEDWLPAYLEAPVWRFALPSGRCGSRAVLGLMLPSVDKAGRYFPLTFAALGQVGPDAPDWLAWLDRCEETGFAALERDLPPDRLADMVAAPDLPPGTTNLANCVWWTEGSPRVPATRFATQQMPDGATYATMLGAQRSGPEAGGATAGDVAWEQPS